MFEVCNIQQFTFYMLKYMWMVCEIRKHRVKMFYAVALIFACSEKRFHTLHTGIPQLLF